MKAQQRIGAAVAYIPVFGWLYVLLFARNNALAAFHGRQSVGLWGFLVASLVTWAVIAWLLAFIPLAFVFAVALFTFVIAAFFYGLVALILGVTNALRGRAQVLPVFGALANRL